ncbi:protein kinase domain-containing protein [Oribacterium sp. FC2011]|uniref:protein kinase domain-containing protein n=1 Tax=Oribacterium sp. FC2011 TaxID=1408311 RepID=UPI0004E2087C|nr:protein kinase [Oribacterium sp. FC2011]
MDCININNYYLDGPLTCDNSGFSKWGIGLRANKKYFIKEFLAPVYPSEDAMFTEEKKQERIRICNSFVKEKEELYSAIRDADDGHIAVVEQFFRVGSKYYISTKAYVDRQMSISDLQECMFTDRLRVCCAVAHSMARIHEKRIIHSDIKPDNILIINNRYIPRPYIIDFDCSFFEYNSPKLGEELNGDMVYLSPEGFLHIAEIESNLSCKMDVFALGLVFHQYLTGEMPDFDHNEYQYAYEAVLDDHPLDVGKINNDYCKVMIQKMLAKKPEDRPDMRAVFNTLNAVFLSLLGRSLPEKIEEKRVEKQEEEYEFLQYAGDL